MEWFWMAGTDFQRRVVVEKCLMKKHENILYL